MKRILDYFIGLLACFAEFGEQQTIPGFTAAVDLSAKQYHIVRPAGTLTCDIASHALGSSAVGAPLGVLQTDPRTGEAATIAFAGLSKVVTGAAVTVNALVSTNGSGRAIDAVSGSVVIGRAIEATSNDGEVATVLLFPPVRWGSVA